MQGALGFWRSFISDPKRVSAIAPSGAALASLITREITVHHAPVIELGPGTGVFTRSLIKRGIPEEQLILVESGTTFIARLEAAFPGATVLHLDARQLNSTSLLGGKRAGAVVSGLPLLSMPKQAVMRIMHSAFSHLREDGAVYQFTYGVGCPVPSAVLQRLGLRATNIGFATANLPPASVYRISRDPSAVGASEDRLITTPSQEEHQREEVAVSTA